MSVLKSVLFIDDKQKWRTDIEKLLADYDYLVDSVAELDAARQKLADTSYQVILVDRRFGTNMDRGLEIIQAIKREKPDQEVILLTAFRDNEAIEAALSDGAFATVKKGDVDVLLAQLQNAILRASLRLSGWERSISQSFLKLPGLETFRQTLGELDDPYPTFVEAALVCGIFGKLQLLDQRSLGLLTKGTQLQENIPGFAEISAEGLQQLALMASHLRVFAGPTTLQQIFLKNDSCFAVNRKVFHELLALKLSSFARNFTDERWLVTLTELLNADFGHLT